MVRLPIGARTGFFSGKRARVSAVDQQLGAGGTDHVQAPEVPANGVERALQRRGVLANPGIVPARGRLVEIRLGVAPAAERLLGEADLRQRARALHQRVRLAELLEGLLIIVLPAQLDAAPDGGVGGIGVGVCAGGARRLDGGPAPRSPERSRRSRPSGRLSRARARLTLRNRSSRPTPPRRRAPDCPRSPCPRPTASPARPCRCW